MLEREIKVLANAGALTEAGAIDVGGKYIVYFKNKNGILRIEAFHSGQQREFLSADSAINVIRGIGWQDTILFKKVKNDSDQAVDDVG